MALATITGTMLTPGVSLNKRLYTQEAIGKAVARMKERIANPNGLPVIMRSHHQAADDSTRIVGRITDVNMDETGNAKYRAELYDTSAGRDIAALVTGKSPALRSVSIFGGWLGPVRQTEHDGTRVETADDLEVDAVDFTATPGVAGALIAADPKATEGFLRPGKTMISESAQAVVTVTEEVSPPELVEADKKPYGNVTYADPGYQDDGVKRYPLDTSAHIRSAWSYVNMPKNAAKYTSSQLASIKAKIKAAMKRIGAKVDGESVPVQYGEVREYMGYGDESPSSSFCIDVSSGPLNMTVRAYCLDPSSLRAVAAAAMNAACDALAAMDPDSDGDIDLPGAPGEDTDNDMGRETVATIGDQLKESTVDAMRRVAEAAKAKEAVAEADNDSGGMDAADVPPSGPTATAMSHDHTHSMSDGMTHVHGHNHAHENAAGSYEHGHSHTHFHLPGGDESHQHVHTHGHETPAGHTAETHEKESAVSETETVMPAAETATPTVTYTAPNALTQADLTALGETIAKSLVAAMTAIKESEPEPEEPEKEEEAQPEKAESAPDPAADRAKLVAEIRDQLRSELIAENGLPQRKGYRISETEVVDAADPKELFDLHRADALLGNFGKLAALPATVPPAVTQ